MSTIYMNLDLPVPTVTISPTWAIELNAALEVVDEHDHTPGKGQQVPTAGLNLDADLALNSNSLLSVHTLELDNLTVAEAGPTNAGRIEQISGDLWYINSTGTAVQLTSGNAISTPTSSNTPAGMIVAYGGSSAPSGYLMMDGTAVSRTTYSALFGAIGTVYGVGDGSTTFNLPNAIGRTLAMAGTYTDPVSGSVSRTLAQSLGAAAHLLTGSESGTSVHNHTQNAHSHAVLAFKASASYNGGQTFPSNTAGTAGQFSTDSTTATNVASTAANAASAHNNMQPTLVVNYIIKT